MILIIFKILTISFPWIAETGNEQEIWKESFSLPGKGIWGGPDSTIRVDLSGVTTWSLDISEITLYNAEDYAKTVTTSGGRFECRDIDGEVTWISEPIDISGSGEVNVRLTAYETGSGDNHETKYLKAFYKLDDGPRLPFSIHGENLGNWGSVRAEQPGLKGGTLRVICVMANFYANDKVTLDEVTVWKETPPLPPVKPSEVVINEILFNPLPGGEDFVEIYNNSGRPVPLYHLSLASRSTNGELTQICPLTTEEFSLPPRSFLALTEDTSGVFPFFPVKCPGCFLQMKKMPSFNNGEGEVVLLNQKSEVLDEFHYTEDMHSSFLTDVEGVSLERVSFTVPAENGNNWHSASTEAGYGTPGYQNSQFCGELPAPVKVTFEPEAFSPNLDGFNDEYHIRYTLDGPGYIARIRIFDEKGRFVMNLAENALLGTRGSIIWNGKDETGKQQPPGIYVILVEIFDDKGKVYRFKDGAVLTRFLN